jgi:hypothetical protein
MPIRKGGKVHPPEKWLWSAERVELLRDIVVAMANGQAVTVAPHNQTLTTTAS